MACRIISNILTCMQLEIQRRKMMHKMLGKISNAHKFPIFEKYINYKTFWGLKKEKIRPVKVTIRLKKTNRKQVALEPLSSTKKL